MERLRKALSHRRPPIWAARCCELEARRGFHFAVERRSHAATFADVVQAWRDDAAFRSLFSRLLAETPFAAFRWETPPVSSSTVMGKFEFVILDSPVLARQPDSEASAEHFASAMDKGVIVLPNLGGDAILESMERRIGSRPVWLSTAGGGVPWLHVRLDDRPKYYAFDPYRGR